MIMYTPSSLPGCTRRILLCCLPSSVDSCYSDIVRHELIGQCQSEVRTAAASCVNRVSRCHCWLILNLIVDGSIRVEWGSQFSSMQLHAVVSTMVGMRDGDGAEGKVYTQS